MNIFGNHCDFGNCQRVDCKNCPRYKPTLFGHRVPKWLFNVVYNYISWIQRRR